MDVQDLAVDGEVTVWLIDGPKAVIAMDYDPAFAVLIMAPGYRPRRVQPPWDKAGVYNVHGDEFTGTPYPLILVAVKPEYARWFLSMPQRVVDHAIIEVQSAMIGEPVGHA